MKIAIVGAGFTGLSASFELLKKGHEVFIFEKDSGPGGLAVGFRIKEWGWSLEKHYHHWFSNDYEVVNLAREINYKILKLQSQQCLKTMIISRIHEICTSSRLSFRWLEVSRITKAG